MKARGSGAPGPNGLSRGVPWLAAALAIALTQGIGCHAAQPSGSTEAPADYTEYLPLEEGRYWVLFDEDSRFLTLEVRGEVMVAGVPAQTLRWQWTRDAVAEPDAVVEREIYLAMDEALGFLEYGEKDYTLGTTDSFLPGVLFLGKEMVVGTPIETVTARSGQLARYTTVISGVGQIEAYYGTFSDGIDLRTGPSDVDPDRFLLARGIGFVKVDLDGTRFQLYDYGIR